MQKAIYDAIELIKKHRPLNDYRWEESIKRLEKCNYSMRHGWEPWKTFSMTPTKSKIRLAHNWLRWDELSRSSNLLHESRHLLDLAQDGWFKFYLKYAGRQGRYQYELAAIKQNIRWWCRLGKIGPSRQSDVSNVTPATYTYLLRVAENFGKNYWMGSKFDVDLMIRTLKDYVLQAWKEGYRAP